MSANVTTNQIGLNAVKCTIATSSYISIPSTLLSTTPSSVFSVSAWFYSLTTATTLNILNNQTIVGSTVYGFGFGFRIDVNKFFVQLYSNSGTPANQVHWSPALSESNFTNRWHHVVFTKAGLSTATWNCYLNGVPLTNVNVFNNLGAGNNTDPGNPFIINALKFNGSISAGYNDSFFTNYQIYNKALTQAEVTSLFRYPLTIPSSASGNLIAQYKFSESNGATVADNIGTNNGTINGYTSTQLGSPQSSNIVRYEYLSIPNNPITI